RTSPAAPRGGTSRGRRQWLAHQPRSQIVERTAACPAATDPCREKISPTRTGAGRCAADDDKYDLGYRGADWNAANSVCALLQRKIEAQRTQPLEQIGVV